MVHLNNYLMSKSYISPLKNYVNCATLSALNSTASGEYTVDFNVH